ncbi:MAG: YopT-type cysteine protease domain-containing protein [Thermoanaerobaculia bacterium]
MRSRIYGVPQDDIIRFHARSQVYSAHLSLAGNNSWIVSWVAGATWSHAIGLYSDQNQVYFFDPNYGVFVFNQQHQGTISLFVKAMWDDYSASSGRIADIV